MIRAIVVDDQALVRAGISRILVARQGVDVVGEFADGDEVVDAVATHRPDVVLMDVRMRRVDGIEATRRVRALPDAPPVLVLTTFDDDEVLSGALRAGAAGFVLKDVPGEDLVSAVHAVARGDAWLDPAVTARVLATYRSAPVVSRPATVPELTARELDVLRLMARGRTNGEIADELVVGEATVKTHVGHVLLKLGARDRAAAIVWAFDNGVVTPAS